MGADVVTPPAVSKRAGISLANTLHDAACFKNVFPDVTQLQVVSYPALASLLQQNLSFRGSPTVDSTS